MAALGGTAVAVERELRAALAESAASSQGSGSLAEWAESLAALRRVVDVATAAQEHVMARLAAVEVEVAEDGTVLETHRVPGHVSVDAAAVVSGALVTTAVHAERRVRAAVERAGDGPEGSGAWTGLGGLHEAMAAGRLDGYRADVVADELEEAPPQVRAAVVAAVQEHLDEDGPRLRRRCRRLLARISPDLVRQRARRARAECRLERWVAEPGVDTWHGTFPSEEAALAWAAIDALAQRYVTDGVVESVDRARAKALTDLVTGNATISTDLVLTVPAGNVTVGNVAVSDVTEGDGQDGCAVTLADHGEALAGVAQTALGEGGELDAPVDAAQARAAMIPGHDRCPAAAEEARTAHPDDLVEVGGPRPSAPLLVPRAWVDRLTRAAADAAGASRGSRRGRRRLQVRSCHPVTGALLPDPTDRTDRADPTDAVWRGDIAGDGDLVAPFDRADGADPGAAPHTADGAATGATRGRAAHLDPGSDATAREGHGPDRGHDTDRDPGPYRPPARLARLVRARDGQCRFPGCHVSARFCDLDHARPWPAGPTTAENLLCLCRRHHRVKQRPGWRLRLTGDATATWTDPTGRTRVTAPRDALHPVVLPHSPDEPDHTPGTPRLDLPRGPHSALEFVLEHHLARRRAPAPAPRLHHSSRGHPTDPPPF